ncbi:MAG: Hsp20/alpha crystallin family protein [Gammaproteobacteria bacterium]|nr:Hsp20/alpha crystallin family protein [Gammaproteobacteria bacterium]
MVEKSHTAGQNVWWPSLMDPLRHAGERIADFFAPSTDASATDQNYEIDIELPGVPSENIDVAVHDGTLTVRGDKHSERTEEGRTFFFSERSYGAFQRSFRLPEDANTEKITAENKDGVLKLRIAKTAPADEKARRIKVKTV